MTVNLQGSWHKDPWYGLLTWPFTYDSPQVDFELFTVFFPVTNNPAADMFTAKGVSEFLYATKGKAAASGCVSSQ